MSQISVDLQTDKTVVLHYRPERRGKIVVSVYGVEVQFTQYGRVYRPNVPVSGLEVFLYSGDTLLDWKTTNQYGIAEFEVGFGEYRIHIPYLWDVCVEVNTTKPVWVSYTTFYEVWVE